MMTMDPLTPGHSDYGMRHVSRHSFDETVARARDELQKEGFGILTEIDLQATLKKKLDVDFPRFLILGACNPNLANQALRAQPDVSLLLPCNVVIRETTGGIELSAMRPAIVFDRLVKDPRTATIAQDAEARLGRALQRAVA